MGVPKIIAIDGPAASGKSTVGQALAAELSYLYFDTGVMYRAVALEALRLGIPAESEQAITSLARSLSIDVRPSSQDDGRTSDVLVDRRDVTWDIRTPEVDAIVSIVAAYPGVRQALTEQQRRIGQRGRVVMVGRDIGTVVLPEADLKIYLEASTEERARRRFEELRDRGERASLQKILQSMRRRDELDSTRPIAPLRLAEDAVRINSEGISIAQVLEEIRQHFPPCDG